MKEPQLYLDISKANPGTPPPPAGGGKGGGSGSGVKYEYWGNRPGTPDPKAGWERTEGGSWRRPEGMGGGGASEKAPEEKAGKPTVTGAEEQAVEPTQEAAPTPQQEVQAELASQVPTKELVSSGEGKPGKVSSAAAKLEQTKQKTTPKAKPQKEKASKEKAPKEYAPGDETATAGTAEEQKVDKEARKQLEQEKTVKEAASKKPSKKEQKKKEPRKPTSPQEKLLLERHNDQVNSLKENVQSHIRWNKDVSPDEKKKLKTVVDALSAHGTLSNLPESEHKQVLSAAKQVAGEYGKKRHTSQKKEAPKEAKPKKKTAKQQRERIKAATGKEAKEQKKKTSLREDPNRLRSEGEPPPLPSKKEQQKMRLEVDRQKKKEATKAEREKKAEENKKAREQAKWDKKIEDAKERIRQNTEAPKSPEGIQEQQAFKNQSAELASNIRQHLDSSDIDEDKRTQLENTLKILETHSELTGLPSQEQKKAQSTAKKLAGEHGKPPKEPKEGKEPKEQKKRPVPYRQWMGAGYRAGQAAGQAAATPEAAGGAAEAPAYAARGATGFGHHLLHNRNVEKQNAEAKKQAKQTPKKGAEVEQSAMKSLNLYIDLNKAVQGDTATQPVLPPEHAKRKHEASYKKRPVGVASEGLVIDNDDDEDDEDTVSKKFKSKDQQKYMFAAAERGEIPKKVVQEFADKTKNYDKLPEDVDDKESVKKAHDGLSPYTEREPIVDENVSTDSEDTNHLYSSPDNSNPGAWAGSKMEDVDPQRSFYEINNKASNLLKSLNQKIGEEIKAATPSSLEAEFMVEILGHSVSEVRKGLCFIKGKDRHRFNEWAAERLSKSISSLEKRFF